LLPFTLPPLQLAPSLSSTIFHPVTCPLIDSTIIHRALTEFSSEGLAGPGQAQPLCGPAQATLPSPIFPTEEEPKFFTVAFKALENLSLPA
jgi:hypothetical protein